MRKTLYLAVAAASIVTTSAFAMGGGGGGGGYSGMNSMPAMTFDDYQTALRLIKHQEYAKAIPHLEAALSQHPKDADVLNYLGYTHRMVGMGEADTTRDGDYKTSLAYYEQALAINPNHRGVHEYLGELYLQMGNLNAAHHEMNQLVILCPDGCDERDTLNKALVAYVPATAPVAAATGAMAPTTAPVTQ